ncbi:hypothetical protein [Actinoplanes sp. DH11]|nr:hypothetical protein [Actinoplanes sp. DH11]
MRDVARINATQPPDWAPTPEQLRQAGQNAAYPTDGRFQNGKVKTEQRYA